MLETQIQAKLKTCWMGCICNSEGREGKGNHIQTDGEPNTAPDRSEVISGADIASEMQETLKCSFNQLTPACSSSNGKIKFKKIT